MLLLALALLSVLAPAPRHAQEYTAIIEGVVSNSEGRRVAGATVEARDPSAATTRTRTRADGTYGFPALAPGSYIIEARAAGYPIARISNVVIQAGQRLVLDLELGAGDRTSPVVAPVARADNSTSISLSRGILARFPVVALDVGHALSLLGTAIPDGTALATDLVRIDGAAASDTRYFIDGMEVTDPRSGMPAKRLRLDFVDEIRVEQMRPSAAWPAGAGAVVRVITKAGANGLHGTLATSFESEWLLGSVRPRWRINPFDNQSGEVVMPSRDEWRHHQPAGDIGGPIVPRSAWFYGAVSYERNGYRRGAIFRNSPPPFERRVFRWYDQARDIDWNATMQLGDALRVKVAGASGAYRTRGGAPALQPNGSRFADGASTDGFTTAAWDSDPALFNQRWKDQGVDRPSSLYNVRLDWVLSPSVVVNVTSGYSDRDARTPSSFYGNSTQHYFRRSNLAMPGIPDALKFGRGHVDNPSTGATVRDRTARFYVDAGTTWYATWAGRHVVKAGVRAERLTDDENRGDQKPTIALAWNQAYVARDGRTARGSYGYYEVSQPRVIGRSATHNEALWLQDSWTLANRLTIDSGVRIENEHVGSYTADPGLDFGFRDKVAPRVGFTYEFGRRAVASTVFGTYGWFYESINSSMAARLLGAVNDNVFVYTLDTYDWPALDCTPAASGCPGTFIDRVDPAVAVNAIDARLAAYFGRPSNAIDTGLKPTRTGELTLGIERELGGRTTVSARYVRKRLSRTIAVVRVVLPGVGEAGFLGNPGFGTTRVMLPAFPQFALPPASRDFDSLDVRLTRRARNWSLAATYVRSSLRGNYSSVGSSEQSDRSCPNCTGAFDSPYSSWDSRGHEVRGPLPADRPHHVKLQAAYDFGWGTSVAAVFEADSGTPLDSRLSWKGATVYFNGRGDLGRTPATSQLDLLLQHELRLPRGHRVTLSANITNVFDQATATLFTTNRWRDTFNFPDEAFFGGWDAARLVQQVRAAGGTLRDNPMYLKPRSYQPPRAVRLGAKYEF